MKYRVGLVVGRFQPFHRGHLYLIKKALKQSERIIIVVGSTNKKDEKNPYSFIERKKQIQDAMKKHKLTQKIKEIIPQSDDSSDDVWLRNLKEKTGEFDVAFGNNEWVNGILEDAGFKVVRVPYHKREIYEGIKIRRALKQSKTLRKKVQKLLP